MRYFVAITLLMIMGFCLTGCGGSDSDTVAADIPLNTDMTLRIGEDRHIAGSRVSFHFTDVVEDSRCPINAIDVLCIQAGTVKVRVGTYLDNKRSGSGDYRESDFSLTNDALVTPSGYGGNQQYRIVINNVQPARISVDPIAKSEYLVTFRVTTAP